MKTWKCFHFIVNQLNIFVFYCIALLFHKMENVPQLVSHLESTLFIGLIDEMDVDHFHIWITWTIAITINIWLRLSCYKVITLMNHEYHNRTCGFVFVFVYFTRSTFLMHGMKRVTTIIWQSTVLCIIWIIMLMLTFHLNTKTYKDTLKSNRRTILKCYWVSTIAINLYLSSFPRTKQVLYKMFC